MNTLKLKVLLILTNKHLWWSISRALLIWISTCLIGSIIHHAVYHMFPLIDAFGLSLLFSSPILLLAVPTLYALPYIQAVSVRVLFSSIVILIACALIIGFVSGFFHLHMRQVAEELFGFIPSAAVCYFIISRKHSLNFSF